jgi:hypothetical protein
MMGHVEICRKLVEIGKSDPHARDKSGRTSYDYGFTLKRKKSSSFSNMLGPGRKGASLLESANWLPPPSSVCQGIAVPDGNSAISPAPATVVQDENNNAASLMVAKPIIAGVGIGNQKFVTSRRICAFCSKKRDTCRMCGQCMKVWYCDEKCQKNHWASHKKNCKSNQQLAMIQEHEQSRPSQ